MNTIGRNLRRTPLLNSFFRASLLLLLGFVLFQQQASLRAQTFSVNNVIVMSAAINTTSTASFGVYTRQSSDVKVYLSLTGADSASFSLSDTLVTVPGSHDTGTSMIESSVSFHPTSIGTYYAQIVLTDRNGSTAKIWITASGTATAVPKGLEGADSAILQAMVGQTGCTKMGFYNPNASGTMTITDISVIGPTASQVTVSGDSLPFTLGAGRSITLNICFSPTAVGNSMDSIIIGYTDTYGASQTLRGRISAFATVNVVSCIQIEGDSSEFYMYPGEVRTRDYKLVNNASSSITLANIYLASGSAAHYAIISPATPATIAGGGSVPMVVQYTADASYQGVAFNARAILTVTTPDTCANELDFYAVDIQPPPSVDSTSVGLLADSTQELDFDASAYQTWVYVTVVNNSGSDEKIDNISLSNFEMRMTLLTPDSSIPFILHNGASMKILLQLVDSTSNAHDDTLIITSEHALTSTMYHIHIGKTAGVSIAQIANVSLTVNPNPSHGNVTVGITGMRNANVQVLDILGRVVAEATNVGSTWSWNGMTGAQSAQNGTYILRAAGIGMNGKTMTESARFVISR